MKKEKYNKNQIPFGTYAGKLWVDLDRSYLEYIISGECVALKKIKDKFKVIEYINKTKQLLNMEAENGK